MSTKARVMEPESLINRVKAELSGELSYFKEPVESFQEQSIHEEDSEADVNTLEAEIDQLVYQLYDLTDKEITIVEGETK